MISAIPEQIGILACPGAASFAAKLTADLEEVSQRKFRRKVGYLAQKYSTGLGLSGSPNPGALSLPRKPNPSPPKSTA